MKTFVFFFALLLTVTAVNASNEYLLVEGRSAAMTPVVQLMNNINTTGLDVYTKVNNSEKNYFQVSYVRDNQIVNTERIHLSDQIINNLKRHLANPQTGESILQVCGSQAGGFVRVLNSVPRNTHTQSQCSCHNCSSGTSSEDSYWAARNYQEVAQANQKADYIINQNDEIIRQVKKARTEAWIQTGINVAGQAASVLILSNNKGRNYTTTTNTTSYYYVGGNTGGRPNNNGGGVWGGNANH